MAPIVHGLEAKYSDRILFTYLDIDDPANVPAMKDLQYELTTALSESINQ
jgi:hypothetical protein